MVRCVNVGELATRRLFFTYARFASTQEFVLHPPVGNFEMAASYTISARRLSSSGLFSGRRVMFRSNLLAVVSTFVLLCGQTYGHDVDGHEHETNPLNCNPAAGEACYYAVIDDFHSNPSTTDSMGEVFLALNSERTEVRYLIALDDLLGLKPDPVDRTEPDDILGVHFHLHVPDTIGPHILNIFGLATPTVWGQEDADLVVDYEHHTFAGIYDISDATIDPGTGQPYPQFFFATTKVIYDWLGYLDLGEWVVAIHTNESGFAKFALHGHISRVIPEPATGLMIVIGAMVAWTRRFRVSR